MVAIMRVYRFFLQTRKDVTETAKLPEVKEGQSPFSCLSFDFRSRSVSNLTSNQMVLTTLYSADCLVLVKSTCMKIKPIFVPC